MAESKGQLKQAHSQLGLAHVCSMLLFLFWHANSSAILLSGNITGTRLLKWSATANGKLCSATNLAKQSSAQHTWSESFLDSARPPTTVEIVGCLLTSSTLLQCFLLAQCLFIWCTRPPAIEISTPHNEQNA